MGVVYRAYDRVHRVDVALKTLRALDGSNLYRFKNEFRSLAGIVHPNLVTLYELQSVSDEWFFTMELIEGSSFLQHVRPYEHLLPTSGNKDEDATPMLGPDTAVTLPSPVRSTSSSQTRRECIAAAVLDVDRLRDALRQLVLGLDALHRAGKLHRDIKPPNVLVGADGRVVVCDFGLVAETDRRPTRAGEIVIAGTPAYMSPEQAAGDRLRPPSDWYGVGVMLYEALTGHVPHSGSADEILAQKQTSDPPPPSYWAATVDEALSDLCIALLQRDPSARPTAADILATLGNRRTAVAPSRTTAPERRSPFVGRERQRAALTEALEDTRRGQSVAVLVHGPSGMGKTALLRQFLDDAIAQDDLIVLEGRCYERESVPYKSLDGLVDSLSNLLIELPSDEAVHLVPRDIGPLARLFPVLRRVEVLREPIKSSPSVRSPQELRLRAFMALRDLLDRLARRQPTIVYIDDLQWGDVDSAFFLEDLLHSPNAPPLVFVGCYRSDEVQSSALLKALLQQPPVGLDRKIREISVDPLSRDESRELAVTVLASATAAAQRAADEIAREAGGNPLFVTELARTARQQGVSAAAGRLNLDDVLRRRITDLPEEARALLTASSVAGRPIALTTVSRAAGVHDEPSALAVLRAEHMVRTHSTEDGETIEPFHDRIREVATARLSPVDLRRMHRRLARAFETTDGGDPLALVEHWLGANVPERAAAYAVRAAAQAEETLAFDRAVYHYRLALKLMDQSEDDRRTMQVRLADALANSGNLAQAAETYLSAAQGASPQVAAELRRRALKHLLRTGKNEQGLALAREVLRDVGLKLPRSHPAAMLSVLLSRARLAIRGIEFKERPADEIQREEVKRLDVFWSVGSGLSLVDPVLGTAFQMRNLVTALRVGEPYRAALALSMEIGYRSFAGGRARDDVMQLVSTTRQLAEQSNSPHAIGVCLATSGLAQFSMGDFDGARSAFERAESTLIDNGVGERWDVDVCRTYRMGALWYLGRISELERTVSTLLREAVETGDEFLARGLRAGRSNAAWLALDAPDEALRQLELAAIERRRGAFHMPHFYALFSRCQIDLYRGDSQAAWQRLEESWKPLKRSMLVRRAESIRISTYFLRARCALAAAAASTRERERYLLEAAAAAHRLDKERNHWNRAKATAVHGSIAGFRGDVATAVATLRDAVAQFEALDMALHAAATRYRLGEILGGDDGAELAEVAGAWMASEKIANPRRMAATIMPLASATARP